MDLMLDLEPWKGLYFPQHHSNSIENKMCFCLNLCNKVFK